MRRLLLAVLVAAGMACDAAVPLPDGADAPPDALAEEAHRERAGAESEGTPAYAGTLRLADGTQLVEHGGRLTRDASLLTEALASPVVRSEDGERFAWVERIDGGPETRLVVCTLDRCLERTRDGHPDRLALSADGRWLAWVASREGLPAVHAGRFLDDTAVVLTNAGLDRSRPGRPPGFVPPPHEGPLRIDGDRIVWTSPDGEHAVELP